MPKIKKIFLILTGIFFISGLWAQEIEKQLSLEDCILSALENNLGVAVEILNPELTNISVSLAQEKFLPQFSIGLGRQNTNSASFSWIEATDKVTSDYNDYSAEFTQAIPTGGSFSVSFYSYKSDTNTKFQMINPRYGSSLTFNFSQPLLKNFGFKASRKEIIIAKNNMDISEIKFKSVLMDTIYNVEKAYWDLVYSIENLKVKKNSLKLAQDLLVKNKREVEVGTLAPIEILSAQAEVATREADILQAETLVRNNEDSLRTLINLMAEEDGVKIIPAEKPAYEEREVGLKESLVTGMENRPDLQQIRLDLKNKNIDLNYAKNQLLPDLSLNASYWSPGISGSQILYKNNDPFSGEIIGLVPGGASNALKDAFGFKYKNWYVGVTLSIPFNSIFSRAAYAQARVNLEKSLLNLKNQEQQAFLEIRNAVRGVQSNYKRVYAYKAARELAEKKLEAEEKKLKVGLTTNYMVLQYQRDLADAKGNELKAVVDYNLSMAALDKSLGISLKNNNIKLSDITRKTY